MNAVYPIHYASMVRQNCFIYLNVQTLFLQNLDNERFFHTPGPWTKFLSSFFTMCYSLQTLHIQYCISAWGGSAECYLKQIITMQKRIVRYVCCVPALTPTNPLFMKTGLLK